MILHPETAGRKAHGFRAYIPVDLDLSFLPDSRRDAARYFVGRLYLGRHVAGKDPDEFQEMYSPLLQRLLGSDYRSGVIDPLLDHGVVEEDPSYSTGRNGRRGWSKGFRLASPYRHERFRVVPITHPEMARRLAIHRAIRDASLDHPIYQHLWGWFRRLTVRPDYPTDVLPLRVLADDGHRMEPCRQGRLHTNLSNLARDYRKHLVLDGVDEPLVCIDVKTCQPLLLGLTLRDRERLEQNEGFRDYAWKKAEEWEKRRGKGGKKKGREKKLSYVGDYSDGCLNDIGRFVDLCLSSDLYQVFVDATGYDRDKAKKKFLATVYGYPEPAEGTRTGRAFRDTFPGLWKLLKELNGEDNSRLPRFLQTVESWLVIWRTCGRLAREYSEAPLLTIHDCLVTTEAYVEPFRRVLADEFRSVWGVCPQTDDKALAA